MGVHDKFKADGLIERYKARLVAKRYTQARAWFDRFTKAILKQGYNQTHIDHTLFIQRDKDNITILNVYVDDIVITGNDKAEMERVMKDLALEFEMKDLRYQRYFLGMEIARNKTGISVSQRKYVWSS